jgi:hypothetical protein
MNTKKQPVIRVADADESTPKIDFAYIDRKYKEWLIRRGFATEETTEMGMRSSSRRRAAKNHSYDE